MDCRHRLSNLSISCGCRSDLKMGEEKSLASSMGVKEKRKADAYKLLSAKIASQVDFHPPSLALIVLTPRMEPPRLLISSAPRERKASPPVTSRRVCADEDERLGSWSRRALVENSALGWREGRSLQCSFEFRLVRCPLRSRHLNPDLLMLRA